MDCLLQAVMQQAKQALESPRLTGEAVIKEAGSGGHEDQNTPPNQGFDMGQVRSCILACSHATLLQSMQSLDGFSPTRRSLACRLTAPSNQKIVMLTET